MATTDYRKAYEEAAGDKTKYYELCRELPERHAGTATILWKQFERARKAVNLVDDFKVYLNGLEKQDLLALLVDLIGDDDGLNPQQMQNILKRSGVEAYQ